MSLQIVERVNISSQRLYQSLMDLARIGATAKGGNCRLALTALDGQGRDLVTKWMREAGLTVTVDLLGNIFARRDGSDNNRAPIMTGSHIDTQPTGGKFDGCFGVLAGLEVMRTLNDHGITTRAPLEVAIWTNEEGSRFVPVMMGSGAFTGQFELQDMLDTQDAAGLRVADELKAIGYAGDQPVGGRVVGAYLEAHIEQGPILEDEGKTIGVVTGSLGLRWYDVTVTGMEMHAGPTPMRSRRDALHAASGIVQGVIAYANSLAPDARATVGSLTVYPGSRNVIPGRVTLTVDLRHPQASVLQRMCEQFETVCKEIADAQGVEISITEVSSFPPTPFDTNTVEVIRQAVKLRGYAHMDIVTGAGHDAVNMASITPTAMIFIPCKDGISHNETEDATPEDLAAGTQVLCDTMLALSIADNR